MAVHWQGPADGTYRLGLQGAVVTADGGGTACRFSFDERFAHADGGTYSF